MRITPIEIRQKTFEKNFRGYNIDEVDAFLHSLSVVWENIVSELNHLGSKLQKSKDEVIRLKSLENSLIKTIESSDTTADNIIRNAEEQATTIIEKAQLEAKKLLLENKNELENLNTEIKIKQNHNNSISNDLIKIAREIIDKHEKNSN